ncbi:MAG: glutathione S-transferase family protein [Proteobacteria bacterium]|nr:glutathione S-transferase family protein [Pseudomonadota bacterium]
MPSIERRAASPSTSPPRLITMAHSHYAEKARWALDLTGRPYVEDRHLPLFHRLRTRPVGGRSVPVLVVDGHAYTQSADIVEWAAQDGAALLPTDPERRSTAIELERWLDRELGPHTRRWAYSELLASPDVLNRCVAAEVPPLESLVAPAWMVLVRPMIRRAFRITPESAARSLERVDEVFRIVADRLAEGDGWLAGASFSAADLTFAALASPVLLPTRFGGALPRLEDVPPAMQAEVRRLRDSPAGRHALDCYRLHRARLSGY